MCADCCRAHQQFSDRGYWSASARFSRPSCRRWRAWTAWNRRDEGILQKSRWKCPVFHWRWMVQERWSSPFRWSRAPQNCGAQKRNHRDGRGKECYSRHCGEPSTNFSLGISGYARGRSETLYCGFSYSRSRYSPRSAWTFGASAFPFHAGGRRASCRACRDPAHYWRG